MKHNSNHTKIAQTNARHLPRQRWVITTIAFLLLGLGLYQLWLLWPSLVISAISWQREVNAQLADLLYDAKTNPLVAGTSLAGFSFIYGMLHSLGPGHGKVIVTTYLATHPTKVKTSLILTVISSLCQGRGNGEPYSRKFMGNCINIRLVHFYPNWRGLHVNGDNAGITWRKLRSHCHYNETQLWLSTMQPHGRPLSGGSIHTHLEMTPYWILIVVITPVAFWGSKHI